MSEIGNSSTDLGSDVLKQIGTLEAASSVLDQEAKQDCGVSADEVANIFVIIGRAILKILK